MPEVILLYDPDCPNVADARTNLLRAFSRIGQSPKWEEVDRSATETPAELRRYGSPTILVDGRDVAGVEPSSDANCCRVYRTESGRFAGVPGVEEISGALRGGSAARDASAAAGTARLREGWKGSLGVLPAISVAILPSVTCPACWPAYAALLSSVGIGFLPTAKYLFPLTLLAVAFALAVLAWQARVRHRFGPLLLATVGAAVLLFGRFGLQSDAALYTGVGLLVAGSVWNAWPARLMAISSEAAGTCPECKSSAQTKSGRPR